MSVILCNRKRDSVTMLTDAASCRMRDGVLAMIASKAYRVGDARCVISALGSTVKMEALVTAARARCGTFDEVVRRYPELIDLVEPFGEAPEINKDQWTRTIVVVAGWSETRKRPESYVARHGGAVLEVAPRLMFPGVFETNDKRAAANYDPLIQGLETVEVVRKSPTDHGFIVGGFVELTTISAGGVFQKVIRRWPDRVGEAINPFRGIEEVAA